VTAVGRTAIALAQYAALPLMVAIVAALAVINQTRLSARRNQTSARPPTEAA
jgi:hypothetical protein